MIIATITAIMVFFGGGMFSFDVFKNSADKVIEDKDRVKQIKVITKEADKELKLLNKSINNESKKLVTLNSNYGVTREELDSFLAQQDQYREQFQERLIELRFQVKKLVKQEEWEDMYEQIDKKALK
jgi:hypothetical protein